MREPEARRPRAAVLGSWENVQEGDDFVHAQQCTCSSLPSTEYDLSSHTRTARGTHSSRRLPLKSIGAVGRLCSAAPSQKESDGKRIIDPRPGVYFAGTEYVLRTHTQKVASVMLAPVLACLRSKCRQGRQVHRTTPSPSAGGHEGYAWIRIRRPSRQGTCTSADVSSCTCYRPTLPRTLIHGGGEARLIGVWGHCSYQRQDSRKQDSRTRQA
jgi:hypothetical protein